ncbi:aquaporin-12-like [Esox lucius]|uniref:Aquaporin n=1 Tax=Esox lucius TaxID=8010 RepID=A0AAY5K3K1_ESOLU|nr:aquaporin-12-like [Esox lucius]
MSGLNVSLAYFLTVVAFGAAFRVILGKCPHLSFAAEFTASFVLVACWLEVQTIMEVGEWAGGLGPEVPLTILCVVLLTHGVLCGRATGNPSLTLMNFLLLETLTMPTLLDLAAQFLGAQLSLLVAGYYWALELNDMHMIKNLMSKECSTTLRSSLMGGVFSECVCSIFFYLLYLRLRHLPALIRVPLVAAVFTVLSYAARGFTSAFLNPSLAYGLTFYCPGFSFMEYSVVYWLAPIIGMILAVFAKNLLYSHKTHFRVPKGKKIKS